MYLATVEYGIAHCDLMLHAGELPGELPLEECLNQVFLTILQDKQCIKFQYKALAFASDKEEFQGIVDRIVAVRQRLYHFFWDQCDRHIQQHHLTGVDPTFYADALALMLEGIFMVENLNLPVSLSSDWVKMHVGGIISTLKVHEEEPH